MVSLWTKIELYCELSYKTFVSKNLENLLYLFGVTTEKMTIPNNIDENHIINFFLLRIKNKYIKVEVISDIIEIFTDNINNSNNNTNKDQTIKIILFLALKTQLKPMSIEIFMKIEIYPGSLAK